MAPNIVTIADLQYEVQPKNFWTQRELERKLNELYESTLPEGKKGTAKDLQAFLKYQVDNEPREFLEIAFDVVFKPVNGGPSISSVLSTTTLTAAELTIINEATQSFSASSSVSGVLPAKSQKPSKSAPRSRKVKA